MTLPWLTLAPEGIGLGQEALGISVFETSPLFKERERESKRNKRMKSRGRKGGG